MRRSTTRTLAAALAKAAGKDVSATHLPFDTIEIEGSAVRFTAFGKPWTFDAGAGTVLPATAGPEARRAARRPARSARGSAARGARTRGPSPSATTTSSSGRRTSRSSSSPRTGRRTTRTPGARSPGRRTSPKLVALRTKKAEPRVVTIVESSPRDPLQPRVMTYPYPKPGDKLPVAKPHLFDVANRTEIPVPDDLFPNPWELRTPHWLPDGSAFRFVYNQRGHQVLRVIEVDAKTGKPRALIDEHSKTFIDYAQKQYLREIESTNELIWMSERDGWNHLYLIDGKTGAVKNPITKGEWVVRGVDRIDEAKRKIWFRAGGIYAEQDPYYVHYCRVNFDGTGLVKLTAGDGIHNVRYSPDSKYLLDTYSRVDLAPVTELRRVEDGTLVCVLERGRHERAGEDRVEGAGAVRRQGPRRQDRHLRRHLPADELRPGQEVPGDRAASTPGRRGRSCPRRSPRSTGFRSWPNWASSSCRSTGWARPTGPRRFTTSAGTTWATPGFPTASYG